MPFRAIMAARPTPGRDERWRTNSKPDRDEIDAASLEMQDGRSSRLRGGSVVYPKAYPGFGSPLTCSWPPMRNKQ